MVGPPHSGKCDPRSLLDPALSPSHPGFPPPSHTADHDDCDAIETPHSLSSKSSVNYQKKLFIMGHLLKADRDADLPENAVHLAARHDRLLGRFQASIV